MSRDGARAELDELGTGVIVASRHGCSTAMPTTAEVEGALTVADAS